MLYYGSNILYYYMASNTQGWIEFSDWLFFSRDFTVQTIAMETVRLDIFFSIAQLPENLNC